MLSSKAATAGTARKAPGQKKSCDLCVFRKRKCDGAIPTCGFCQARGSKCHYSLRRPNRPRGYARRVDGEDRVQPGVKVEGELASVHGDGGNESLETQHGQPHPPPIGWKRVRLSASPATGLVGTKENVFLGCFFSCLGFLPLTDERLIRGTMMEILLTSPPGSEAVHHGTAESPNIPKNEMPTTTRSEDEAKSEGDAASACALWCTIAMGALVQGQPPEQAAPYMHLAWTSLSQCFDTVTVESGRAFLMMAYLFNFMGDAHNFCRYLRFARRVTNRLPANTVQKQEIDDLVMMGNDTRIFHTAALEPSELEAYCTDESPALEVPDVVLKSDLCRLLLQADRRMMKAFLRDHRAQVAVPVEHGKGYSCHDEQTDHIISERGSEDGKGCHWLDKTSRDGWYPDGGEAGYLSGMSINVDGICMDSTTMDQQTSPSRPGDETWKYSEEARKVFGRLQEVADALARAYAGWQKRMQDENAAASRDRGHHNLPSILHYSQLRYKSDMIQSDHSSHSALHVGATPNQVVQWHRFCPSVFRPEVRAGVGSLLYNSVLGYLDMVTGSAELEPGFEKVKHCAEIISRYPGLCRFSTWRHLSHCLLSFLAKLGDAELFEELRQAYNSVCAEDAPEVPPHSEWTMVGFCDHIFCRSMDHLDKTWGGTNLARPSTARDVEGQRWWSEELHWPHDTPEASNRWTCPAAISGQPYPAHGWTDGMLSPLMDRRSASAQQLQYMAPAPSFPPVGPHSLPFANPVWSTAGDPLDMPCSDRARDGASAHALSARAGGYTHNGWNAATPYGATNASFGHHGADELWPFYSSEAAARSAWTPAPTATLAYGGEIVHHAAVGGEEESRGTSGTSDSEGGHGAAQPSADRCN